MSDSNNNSSPFPENMDELLQALNASSSAEIEKAQAAAKAQAKAKAQAQKSIGEVVDATGTTVQVTMLDAVSSQIRQSIVRVLKQVDPAGYQQYVAAKYKDCPKGSGIEPSLEQRIKAYELAFKLFLAATYKHPGV